MTDTSKLWKLTRTEYAGQCTGFGEETIWLAVFTTKPDLKTLAPYLGQFLSNDMGVAIAQVQTLIDKGVVTLHDRDFELDHFEPNQPLHKD